MKIDVRSEKSLYIEMDGWTFYVDNSTDEQIMSNWETNAPVGTVLTTVIKDKIEKTDMNGEVVK
tara:strand:+ start:139 stop:330 length:192 start_codon:yes stop_codon:yes gene_type:complete